MDGSSMEPIRFLAASEDGSLKECEALFMFESPETQRNYLVYTDNSTDEDGNLTVFASAYDSKNPIEEGGTLTPFDLVPIDTEEEWEIIESVLVSVMSEDSE